MINDNEAPRPLTEEELFGMKVEQLVASSVPCEVEGCDGSCRSQFDYPADWIHEVGRGTVGDVRWTLDVCRGAASASLYFPDHADTVHAARLRQLADAYEGLPATLRALADELDRRNAS